MEVSEMIEALRGSSPWAVELAKVVSLATRVEPGLLRRARLELLPAEAGAEAEADLWFSPLVESRSPVGLVLVREAADALRAELLQTRELFEASWRLVRAAHRGSHPTIRLEERLVRLVLAGEDDESTKPAAEEIEELLHEALAGLASADAVGVARWALRAVPSMPESLLGSAAAEALALGAGARLGGRRVLGEEKFPEEAALEKLRWVLPEGETVRVGVRLLEHGVEFSEPPAPGSHKFKAPKTNPVPLELLAPPPAGDEAGADDTEDLPDGDLFYESGGNLSDIHAFRERVRQSRRRGAAERGHRAPAADEVVARVSLPLGRRHVEPVAARDLRIRTARGDLFALRPAAIARPRKDYWFYLSYSPALLKEREFLFMFYEDLARHVGELAGLPDGVPEARIGFFDLEDFRRGPAFEQAHAEALNASRTFVCLLSRSYFQSEANGREFQLFLKRLEAAPPVPGYSRPPLILSVEWEGSIPFRALPPALQRVQRVSRGVDGLGDLLRQNRVAEYRELVAEVARVLVDHARKFQAPPLEELPPLAELESAFGPPPDPEQRAAGPRHVLFVFVSGRAEELSSRKKDVGHYGTHAAGGEPWRPFPHESEETAAHMAQRLAASLSLTTERSQISGHPEAGEQLRLRLAQAEAANQLVVFLVDPWALSLSVHRSVLQDIGRMGLVNCAVLLLWNERDEDLSAGGPATRESLSAGARAVFSKWRFGGSDDLAEVRSPLELGEVLTTTLRRLQERMMRNAGDWPPP